jgi:hypothetical protein
MTVHTALECLALGLISGHAAFVALFAAVASHKAISALALSAKFVREGATTKEVRAWGGDRVDQGLRGTLNLFMALMFLDELRVQVWRKEHLSCAND